MISCIRDVRRAKGFSLQDVADSCVPPTTAQTIGRLETGTRTLSLAWLNRIAAALGVTAADLVAWPARHDLPVVATLGPDGAVAPRRPATIIGPSPTPGQIAILVHAAIGDFRNGDEIWCDRLAPNDFASARNRDILLPLPAGRLLFGRLIGIDREDLRILSPVPGIPARIVTLPPWIAVAARLVRAL